MGAETIKSARRSSTGLGELAATGVSGPTRRSTPSLSDSDGISVCASDADLRDEESWGALGERGADGGDGVYTVSDQDVRTSGGPGLGSRGGDFHATACEMPGVTPGCISQRRGQIDTGVGVGGG